MSKKSRSVISVIIVLTLVLFTLAGCSKTDPAPAAGGSSNSSSNSSSDSGTAAEPAEAITLPVGGHVEAEGVSDKPIRIAFLSWQNNPFFQVIKEGAEASVEYLKNFNCTVDYISMGEDLTTELTIAGIEGAITKEYDAIIVCPVFDGTEEYINKAVDAGIPVATFCAESSDPGKRLFFYGQNAYVAGQLHGKLIEEYTGGEGKVGVITGVLGAPSHDARMNGAIDYLKENCPGITIIGPYENSDKGEVAYSQTNDMLTANPDLKVVYVTAGGPFGAAKAVQDAGLTGKVGVFAYDHTPENLEYVASGEIVGLVNQDPFGQGFDTNVIMFNYLVFGTQPASDFIECALDVVTPDSIKELYPDYAN
ncbi:ABC transporter substrate-binding protein [Clostridia bacterium]|nr:ABC transporter substrate-binding protein [Clostridia bacterium]